MKDLVIKYDNENGERIKREYDYVFDFTNEIESNNIDIPMMDYENVEADFFENPLLHRDFNTIEELYIHCKNILK